MPSEPDPGEFVDGDLQSHKTYAPAAGQQGRAPTREELTSKVSEAQQKLADLKRAQEDLERERASLEESRRRQAEFQTGRQEMIHQLTRGLGILEEAEFGARREAEQMAKSLGELRDALAKIEAIHDETWTKDTYEVELTRALTTLENARMEWNSARLKFPVLTGGKEISASAPAPETQNASLLQPQSFGELCRLGLAFTWPVALVALLGVLLLAWFVLRH